MIEVYLVGGAVRDKLLNLPVIEHDYLVVGANIHQMLNFGFNQVGADFPVFLHPDSHEEYALARTERKTGNGYLGFQIDSNPKVTVTDDLSRRDLTINAMAIQVHGLFDNRVKTGDIVDPFNGQSDLENRILRHVSPAFAEDPVRVLRLARFASRYAPLDFQIADETKQLVEHIKQSGELNHLVAERVWVETQKALSQPWADIYFKTLHQLKVLDVIMPSLFAILQNMPTSDYQIWQTALRLANQCQLDNINKFAIFSTVFLPFSTHQLAWQNFCESLKVPKNYQNLAKILLENFNHLKQINQLNTKETFSLLQKSQALKQPEWLQQAMFCCHLYQTAKQQQQTHDLINQLKTISAKDVDPNLQGKAIGEAIYQLRLQHIDKILNNR